MMSFLRDNSYFITAALMFLLLIVAALTMALMLKVQKIKRQYEKLLSGVSEQNVEEVLIDYLTSTKELESRTKALEVRMGTAEMEAGTHLQNIGMVRYNAFEGVGGEQSFSLALLDDKKNGITITGIFGHSETRVYAKPIEDGSSKYNLSPEELEAISKAVGKYSR
ncbi:MAG TPA: DUF4446 family protein [Bacillota bacterium]|nr:DUF4446 family protein [Bacillota bacterium]HOH10857.1 DUF4446 family protein [Bacillota bacterium]HPI00802.1 DUF4446 family protein [Bacillota bacterium]